MYLVSCSLLVLENTARAAEQPRERFELRRDLRAFGGFFGQAQHAEETCDSGELLAKPQAFRGGFNLPEAAEPGGDRGNDRPFDAAEDPLSRLGPRLPAVRSACFICECVLFIYPAFDVANRNPPNFCFIQNKVWDCPFLHRNFEDILSS